MRLLICCMVLLSYLSYLNEVYCAKILAIFHYPCQSHHILGSTLLKGLASKGHDVTMMSAFPFETPIDNYRDIDIPGMLEYKETHIVPNFLEAPNAAFYEKATFSIKNVEEVAKIFFESPRTKDLLHSDEQFDLIILNWSMNEAFLGIAHHMKAPVIAFSTIGPSVLTNKITMNPASYSYIPHLFSDLPNNMNFLQRLENSFFSVLFELIDNFVNGNLQRDLLRKYFPNAPPLEVLIKNISLVFLNSHYGIESPRPFFPNMIEIGGFHVPAPKELSGKLKQFMDEATSGVVFVSLGTNVKSSNLPAEKLNLMIKTFKKLEPIRVLFKFEKQFEDLPDNVMVAEWLPQTDILAHKNTKAFVTHGGRLSTIEAIYFGIPIVGIPFFSDQHRNIADSVNGNYGISLDFRHLTEESLSRAINEALNNPKFSENAKLRSRVLNDQPLKQLDKAIFWVEYVLRHRGAPHLQSTAVNLTWYQYTLLDVILFSVVVCTVTIFAIISLIRKLRQVLTPKTKRKIKVKKH